MKKSEFSRLAKRLLPSLLPGFTVTGELCIVSPFSGTLRGFLFEGSAFDKESFYVNMFFLPLYVPTKLIHLTFGHRVGNERNQRIWNSKDPMLLSNLGRAMQKDRSFLLSLNTPIDLVRALEPLAKRKNPHCREAFAYSLILAGEKEAAREELEDLVRMKQTYAWEQEVASRATLIRDRLRSQPESAKEQLVEWERENARNLKVESSMVRKP